MSKIHIIPSEFNKELELQLAYSIVLPVFKQVIQCFSM